MNLALAADTTDRATAPLEATVRLLFDRTFYLDRNPDVAGCGIDPLEHFLQYGVHEGRAPHAAFDPAFYAAQMPPMEASEPAFLHYLRHGADNGLDPHPLFDTAHYLSRIAGGAPDRVLPLLHFLQAGPSAELSPNPLFDPAYYRRANRMGAAHPRHPLLHYIETGWRSGAHTHPLFDAAFYRARRPDVAGSGVDPLAHYLRCGRHEVASTHELFDAARYRKALAARGIAIRQNDAILHYARRCAEPRFQSRAAPPSPHALFDRDFYRDRHCSAGQDGEGYDPFLHFLEHGLAGNLDPHPLFDAAFYLRRYGDVAAEGGSAFLHFVRHGAVEVRDPHPSFDAASYLSRHPRAYRSRFGALSHHLARTADNPLPAKLRTRASPARTNRAAMHPAYSPAAASLAHPPCG